MDEYHACYTTPYTGGTMRGEMTVVAADPREAKQKVDDKLDEDDTLQSIYANHYYKYNGANGGDLVWNASRGFITDNF